MLDEGRYRERHRGLPGEAAREHEAVDRARPTARERAAYLRGHPCTLATRHGRCAHGLAHVWRHRHDSRAIRAARGVVIHRDQRGAARGTHPHVRWCRDSRRDAPRGLFDQRRERSKRRNLLNVAAARELDVPDDERLHEDGGIVALLVEHLVGEFHVRRLRRDLTPLGRVAVVRPAAHLEPVTRQDDVARAPA